MELNINGKNYLIKLNLRARIKINNLIGDEREAFKKAYDGNLDTIFLLCYCCIQDDTISFSNFLDSYPAVKESVEGMMRLLIKLVEQAGNPLYLSNEYKSTEKAKEPVKIDFRELITTLMSKGYTQKEVLDMTYWDINLIYEADYKKLEREAIHTNAILNIINSALGGKKVIDILGRNREEQRDITLFKNITEILDRK